MCGINLLRERRGLLSDVARGLGLTRAAVTRWAKVPAEHLIEIERISGIPREALRPDLYIRVPTKQAAE
jgi:DNA-binding transcriptional regulator YdaS (Cro superfamily)